MKNPLVESPQDIVIAESLITDKQHNLEIQFI